MSHSLFGRHSPSLSRIMSGDQRGPGRGGSLDNRRPERKVLAHLVNTVRAGESQALVLRGDPGVGKTVLLDHLAELAVGCRVLRVAGVQTEMELAFAGLHQLCLPLLDRLPELAEPRREALRIAFGLSQGPAPDRFLVGLAVLGLLAGAAEERPVVCVIDDHHWLDEASAQALGFVARRLNADRVGMVFGTRHERVELEGLSELPIAGLPEEDARTLLESALTGPLDFQVRDQIIAETRGNPLALLELPRGLTPAQLAGGFGLLAAVPLSGRIEDSYVRQLRALPPDTLRLLQLAAADPSGDSALVLRAAESLGIPFHATTEAARADMAEFGVRVRFRHPLLRSAAYGSASVAERQAMHLALAEATDADADPDRLAWHRAEAASGPDEDVAAALEASAHRARSRGGLAAAAAFLQRAVLLSADPVRRAERILAAAQTHLQAGALSDVLDLLAVAEAGQLDERQAARVELLRGHVSFAAGTGSAAPPLLLAAAKRIEPLDRDLARDTYLTAWMAALFAGRRVVGADLTQVSRAVLGLPPPQGPPILADLVLDALARLVTEEPAAAVPALRKVAGLFVTEGMAPEEELRWGWFAQATVSALWDHGAWRAVLTRQVEVARAAGALDQLPVMLAALGAATAWAGDMTATASLIAEFDAVRGATGSRLAPFAAMLQAGLRGDESEAMPLIAGTLAEARASGQGVAAAFANWASAILHNGLGRYGEALLAAVEASAESPGLYVSLWALPELVEAAVRTGDTALAREALDRLAESAEAAGTDMGLGLACRSQALLSEGAEAERYYREAIDRLGRTQLRPEAGRARLLFGEWLRREGRRVESRTELRAAEEVLAALGLQAFAERARRELLATGERTRRRPLKVVSTLTGQEAFIARLAVEGRTNPEIGSQLFISARTVEWHLRKVFTKLGITSRRELEKALAEAEYQGPDA
ncbi:AAA family ATPase [Streptomyces sp. NPDC051020]|uniref:helix-turn-helix transcriptional regulator n=1 Tax=Streptomyces sp. NPDC051020 TaxID=3155409 RepID=UPI00343B090C